MSPGPLSADALLQALPELLLLLRRDGVILAHSPGRPLEALHPPLLQPGEPFAGRRVAELWSESVAGLLLRLTRKAILQRTAVEAHLREGTEDFEVRASARGPDRALCVLRAALPGVRELGREDTLDASGVRRGPWLDRRGFLRQLREALSAAILRERPLAVAVLHLDGLIDVARLIDVQLSEQIQAALLERLIRMGPGAGMAATDGLPWLFLGQQSDGCLAMALDCADRDVLGTFLDRLCSALREPIDVAGGRYEVTPYLGAALLQEEAVPAKALIERAHAAATEARRSGARRAVFFSDAASLGAHARADAARELRAAIEQRDIRLRYIARHDLQSGRCVAWVGYVRWIHPLRGEIRPVEFLRIAEMTGLATELSRAILRCLREDCGRLRAPGATEVQISFGALRHHVLHEDFVGDIAQFLADGTLPPQALELRIAERTFSACEPQLLHALRGLGVQLVVDEVARGLGSLDQLARSPLWGLQLDRAWVTAVRRDDVALKVCRAGIAMASALGLTPIATGVDDPEQRDALLALGCRLGSGDLYPDGLGAVAAAGP
jgi:predicted signal transduction protein with EAL and GGDEF domain